jgi:hypothetical protein
VKVAVCPTFTLVSEGCCVIEGATDGALTLSVAGLLATLPALLLTTTLNREPSSDDAVAAIL